MRPIAGGHPPPSLAEWKRAEPIEAQRRYEFVPTEIKEQIRDQRVRDQHGLCAYTLRRIRPVEIQGRRTWDAHVEHVVTQKSSRERDTLDQTVDYGNLVACVDRAASLPYGAAARGDTTEALPVTPFHPNCAARFRYHSDGQIEGVDAPAVRTVEILHLRHPALVELRRATVAGRGIGVPRAPTPGIRRLPLRPISAAEAMRQASAATTIDAHGNLPEFCEMLAQLYAAHAQQVERQRQKAAFARRRS